MKTNVLIVVTALILLSGCAGTPLVVPQGLEGVDLNSDCPDEARVVGLGIKATLDESGSSPWLAIYWEPRYYTPREPDVDLVVGAAKYMGQKGNVFYYQCGNLPSGKKIGRIILPAATDKFGPKRTIIEMKRRSNSNCLELIELKRL